MRKLQIYIEIEGKQTYVGLITGDSPQDARFARIHILRQVIRLFPSVCLFPEIHLVRRQQKTFLRDCFQRDLPEKRLQIGFTQQKMII